MIKEFKNGQIYRHNMLITEDIMENFAKLSGDYNILHTDNDFAVKNGFKGRVVYGNILGMMISTLVGMNLKINNVMIISEKMDFRQPVFIGDMIELAAIVENVSDSVSIVDFRLDFTNQSNEKVAKGKLQIKVL